MAHPYSFHGAQCAGTGSNVDKGQWGKRVALMLKYALRWTSRESKTGRSMHEGSKYQYPDGPDDIRGPRASEIPKCYRNHRTGVFNIEVSRSRLLLGNLGRSGKVRDGGEYAAELGTEPLGVRVTCLRNGVNERNVSGD